MEAIEPGHQPADPEGRRNAERELLAVPHRHQLLRRFLDRLEGGPYRRQVRPPRLGQGHAARIALEELALQPLLEQADLLAHGRLAHAQLHGCQAEIRVARRGVEHPQRIQGRQSHAIPEHSHFLIAG